ncbi:MAG: amidase family protein, partial [Candidatus Hodgkinia cicadicola]
GISILFKDQILIKNIRCEASNIILDNYISKYNGEVVYRTLKARAFITGKVNMDSFGVGFSSSFNCVQSPFYSALSVLPSKHLCKTLLSGGSSGGCAVSVALS